MNVSVSADTIPLLVIVFFTGVALGALAALASDLTPSLPSHHHPSHPANSGTTMAASTPRMPTIIKNSIKVKPFISGFASPYSFRVTLNLLLGRIRSSFLAKPPPAGGCSSTFSTSGIPASLIARLEALSGSN